MARILIVEDDPFFAEILACMLGLEGHDVTVANTAGDGVWLGLAKHPDVVVSDWFLRGGMHGGEVCRRIHAAWSDIKIIMMTGHHELLSQAAEYCEGVEAVLAKPFHKEEILEMICRALSGDAAFSPMHSPAAGPYHVSLDPVS